jgi:4-amino-4-deoxy-L-arabinose transferase-like glycosyltransferase
VLIVVLAFAAVFTALRRGEAWRWLVAGALWGIALLTRPNTMFALPGLAIGLVFALRRARRSWWAPALLGLAACALMVTPWIVRNHRLHGEWYFISTGGGRQLWIGNNPRAEADSRVAGFVPDSVMQAETSALPNEIQVERYYYRKGFEYARAHPGRSVILYLRELRNLLAFWPETRTGRHINGWSRTSQGLASAVMFAGALLALRRFRSEPAMWILVGAVASFILGSAIYFAIMRYRMAVEPCLLWMAGAGWDEEWSRRSRPRA